MALESAGPELQAVFKKPSHRLSPFILLPFWRCGLHHRHDAGADRLKQVGPGGHDGGQMGVGFTGVGGQIVGKDGGGLS